MKFEEKKYELFMHKKKIWFLSRVVKEKSGSELGESPLKAKKYWMVRPERVQ